MDSVRFGAVRTFENRDASRAFTQSCERRGVAFTQVSHYMVTEPVADIFSTGARNLDRGVTILTGKDHQQTGPLVQKLEEWVRLRRHVSMASDVPGQTLETDLWKVFTSSARQLGLDPAVQKDRVEALRSLWYEQLDASIADLRVLVKKAIGLK